MKKKLIIILVICLCLFVFRNFLIKQYFISKIEYVDYDEYILLDYLNGKKNKATYVGPDFMVVIEYNTEEVENITAYDYGKMIQYQYNFLTENLDKSANNESRLINLNNDRLLELLKSKVKFKFKGKSKIDSIECYILEFKPNKDHVITMCLAKELMYTVKIEEHFLDVSKDKKITYNSKLDLELKNKDLFKEYIN